jgi:hypothetical protein
MLSVIGVGRLACAAFALVYACVQVCGFYRRCEERKTSRALSKYFPVKPHKIDRTTWL